MPLFGAGADGVKIGSAFFQHISCFYPVYGLVTAFRSYLEGKDDLLYSSMAGITALTARKIASYAMVSFWGNMVIAYTEMFSWVYLLIIYLLRSAQKSQAGLSK